MRRFGLLSLVLLLPAPVRGDMMPPAPIPERVARTALTVVGTVKSIEEKTIELESVAGSGRKTAYQVAVIEVRDSLTPGRKMKQVRVAFVPPPARRRYASANLDVGTEGLFFLTRVPGQEPYRATMYFDVQGSKGNPAFAKQVNEARRAARLLADPERGLAAKDPAERFLTAALLVIRYRTVPLAVTAAQKTVQVPAAQSKRILEVLASANWNLGRVEFNQLTPQTIFYRLGVGAKEGWNPPADLRQLPAAAQAWLRKNAGTYRLMRFVNDAPREGPAPEPEG